MLITFTLAILDAVLAFSMYCSHHYIMCAILIVAAIILGFIALGFEGRMLNRIKQLEEKVKENTYGS